MYSKKLVSEVSRHGSTPYHYMQSLMLNVEFLHECRQFPHRTGNNTTISFLLSLFIFHKRWIYGVVNLKLIGAAIVSFFIQGDRLIGKFVLISSEFVFINFSSFTTLQRNMHVISNFHWQEFCWTGSAPICPSLHSLSGKHHLRKSLAGPNQLCEVYWERVGELEL